MTASAADASRSADVGPPPDHGPHGPVCPAAPPSRRDRRAARWSVRGYVQVTVVGLSLLATTSLAVSYTSDVRALEDRSLDVMDAEVSLASGIVDLWADGAAVLVTEQAARRTPTQACVHAAIDALPGARLDVVGADGAVLCSSSTSQSAVGSTSHADADWLAAARAGTAVQVLATDPATGRPALITAHEVTSGTSDVPEAPGAVVVLVLDGPTVSDRLAALAHPHDRATFAVLDPVERTVAADDGTHARAALGTADEDGTAQGVVTGDDGRELLYASSEVEARPWRVVGVLDRAEMLALGGVDPLRTVLMSLSAVAVFLMTGLVVERKIIRPLTSLIDGAVRARTSASSTHIPERGTAELVTLARELNTMIDVRAGHEARLTHQSTHDLVTGLPTKGPLRETLTQELGSSADLAVLCLGLHRFQTIADSLGRDAADRVLVEVSARLSSTVGPDQLLARSGGEEFMVLCTRTSAQEAAALAQGLHRALAAPVTADATVTVRASVGIAVGRPGVTADELLREADTAMAQARSHAQDVATFDDSMRARAVQQLETEAGLRAALTQDELVVHYQPVVSTVTGEVVGAEALVRWERPGVGLVPPLEFIPLAEETGLIGEIGQLVLDRACLMSATLAARGLVLRMSVNAAAAQLQDPGFFQTVRRTLLRTGARPRNLCVEVTESALVGSSETVLGNLLALRELGVHLAVDDFGTGYSSLAYLKDLPVDELKIDRTFVRRIEHDARDRELVTAVIGMARALDLTVVAEGVENVDQLETLVGIGCPFAQGYLFARPLPGPDFTELVVSAAEVAAAPRG